jgi:hypothetical protein
MMAACTAAQMQEITDLWNVVRILAGIRERM